jgi:addiction module HigA family antidote
MNPKTKTKKARLPNVHPGEILLEEFLKPFGLSQYRVAKDLNIPESRVSDIIRGQRGITADTALRLARYFGTTHELWLNLQDRYEIEEVQRTRPANRAHRAMRTTRLLTHGSG